MLGVAQGNMKPMGGVVVHSDTEVFLTGWVVLHPLAGNGMCRKSNQNCE